MRRDAELTRNGRKPINLALQGGGSHGAFTWGVLDRLFEDDRLEVAAVSGTSAGAMNAAVAVSGLHKGGPEGARRELERFWRRVSRAAQLSPIQRSPFDVLLGRWSLERNPAYVMFDLFSRIVSPYDLNPTGLNPLRDIVEEVVDFQAIRDCTRIALHISATDVETGRGKVFGHDELSVDVVMASACLPQLFQAVKIGDRHYWDGGFMGNPVLYPFYESSPSNDVVIVQINPVVRPGVPRTAREIDDRVNEITFNSSLLRELRAIDFVQRLIEEGRLEGAAYRYIRVHMIQSRKHLRSYGASSKLNAEWSFLRHLFGLGRQAADAWLKRHIDDVGVRQTVDIRQMFSGDAGRREPAATPGGSFEGPLAQPGDRPESRDAQERPVLE